MFVCLCVRASVCACPVSARDDRGAHGDQLLREGHVVGRVYVCQTHTLHIFLLFRPSEVGSA